jgi:hypothetical protein
MAISLIDRNAVSAALRVLTTTRLSQASNAAATAATAGKAQAAQAMTRSRAAEHAIDITA